MSAPLEGLRVVELGQLLAGPWAATILGHFGAEIIKVEPPSGDPIRTWRALDENGESYWSRSVSRNKHCVCIDLRTERGREIAAALIERADVLVENFRPGRMEAWGLGPDRFRARNPGLIYARVSGYGQTGPYRSQPGFASVAEAVGGLRHLTGHPGEPPVRTNLSVGDTLAALHCAIGILVALAERARSDRGQVIDTALYESVFACLESVVTEYTETGVARAPSGLTITGVVPSNAYACANGRTVVIGANGESMFERLMRAIGRDDLARDPTLRGNAARVAQQERVDDAIRAFTKTRTVGEVVDVLVEAGVPCGPINDAAAMVDDPHFQARAMFESIDGLTLPAMAPKLERTPCETRWAGRALGRDTDAVLSSILGLDASTLATLHRDGVL